jgi:hypothetical protein
MRLESFFKALSGHAPACGAGFSGQSSQRRQARSAASGERRKCAENEKFADHSHTNKCVTQLLPYSEIMAASQLIIRLYQDKTHVREDVRRCSRMTLAAWSATRKIPRFGRAADRAAAVRVGGRRCGARRRRHLAAFVFPTVQIARCAFSGGVLRLHPFPRAHTAHGEKRTEDSDSRSCHYVFSLLVKNQRREFA